MKQSDLAQAYRKYLGPKCSRTTFYSNIRKGMSLLDAIKPITKKERYKTGKVRTSKFKQELEWYFKQKGDKVSRSRFYQRLYQGWSKEDAIKTGPIEIHYSKNKKKTPIYKRPITPVQKSNVMEEDICVRYNEDEYRIFCFEYEKMINELQEQYYNSEGDEAREISNRLDKLSKEYQNFKLCNNDQTFNYLPLENDQ